MTEREFYYQQHKCCPKCGNDKIDKTTIGFIFTGLDAFGKEDDTKAKCQCGWIGIVHNLTPGKP